MIQFNQLQEIIEKLRNPETGCPWDKKQTSESLIPNLIEEVYEAVQAIEDQKHDDLCEELGDILLHVVFQVKLAEEMNRFTMNEVLEQINSKLIRRHPHIFSSQEARGRIPTSMEGVGGGNKIPSPISLTETEVKLNWEKIKLAEKGDNRKSVLEGVPRNLPALIQAQRIQEKAAHIGFDWESYEPVFDKIQEEINEVKEEIAGISGEWKIASEDIEKQLNIRETNQTSNLKPIEMEIGDLLFAVVNLARKLNIDSETALRRSTEKFKTRFQKLEKLAEEQQINMSEVGLEKLDELWEAIKKS